jgi:hypothetical protein
MFLISYHRLPIIGVLNGGIIALSLSCVCLLAQKTQRRIIKDIAIIESVKEECEESSVSSW